MCARTRNIMLRRPAASCHAVAGTCHSAGLLQPSTRPCSAHHVLLAVGKRVAARPAEAVVLKGALIRGAAGKAEAAVPVHLIVDPLAGVRVAATRERACRTRHPHACGTQIARARWQRWDGSCAAHTPAHLCPAALALVAQPAVPRPPPPPCSSCSRPFWRLRLLRALLAHLVLAAAGRQAPCTGPHRSRRPCRRTARFAAAAAAAAGGARPPAGAWTAGCCEHVAAAHRAAHTPSTRPHLLLRGVAGSLLHHLVLWM
jgi:hypothetical protein